MTPKIPLDLEGVPRTLVLPLWGRAVESKKPAPLLIDSAAENIIASIDYDFSCLAAAMRKTTQLAWIARALEMDAVIKYFYSVIRKLR